MDDRADDQVALEAPGRVQGASVNYLVPLSPARLYWRCRYAWLDFRDGLFVRAAIRRMQNDAVLFIHPNDRSGPALYMARIDATIGAEPHGHIEGKAR